MVSEKEQHKMIPLGRENFST